MYYIVDNCYAKALIVTKRVKREEFSSSLMKYNVPEIKLKHQPRKLLTNIYWSYSLFQLGFTVHVLSMNIEIDYFKIVSDYNQKIVKLPCVPYHILSFLIHFSHNTHIIHIWMYKPTYVYTICINIFENLILYFCNIWVTYVCF